MKKYFFWCLILFIFSTNTVNASNQIKVALSSVKLLAEFLMDTNEFLDDIKKRQAIELLGELNGLTQTLSDLSLFSSSKERVKTLSDCILPTNVSLGKTELIAIEFIKENNIEFSTKMIDGFKSLIKMKKIILNELNHKDSLIAFEKDFAKKLHNLEQYLRQAKIAICKQKYAAVSGGVATGAVVGVAGACAAGAGIGTVAGAGILSAVTAPIGCIIGAITVGAVGGGVASTVFSGIEECEKIK